MLVKNEGLSKEVKNYFEEMINDFCDGNDNVYSKGEAVSFVFENDEKGEVDYYGEEEVEKFNKTKLFIKSKGGEVKYISNMGDDNVEFTFKLINEDIKCSFVEWLDFII